MNLKTISSEIGRLAGLCAAAASLCAVIGCSEATHPTGTFVDVPVEGWAYGENFAFPAIKNDSLTAIPDSTRLVLAVRHTNDYEYANLWLAVSYRTREDSVVADTVDIKLADDFGKWYGSGIGLTVMRYDTLTLRHPRRVLSEVDVRHIMRVDTIRGIEQIGVLPVVLESDL